ncbi:hypothetical protein KA001_03005 [Patescibacteria group bacterium]|nr:hypothetical protein [Patescibacteria group bacterium]
METITQFLGISALILLIFPKIIVVIQNKFPNFTYIFGITSSVITIISFSFITFIIFALGGEVGVSYQTKFAFLASISWGIIFFLVFGSSKIIQKLWKINPTRSKIAFWLSIMLTFPIFILLMNILDQV